MKNTRIRAMLSLVSAFGVFTGSAAWADLIITGVFDGPLPGGNPKGVELYATEDIPDLATYALGVANNGGGTDGVETILPSQSLAAGSFFFVATEDQDFAQWFGSAPGHVGGNGINHNGCDAIELFFDSSAFQSNFFYNFFFNYCTKTENFGTSSLFQIGSALIMY